MQEQETELSCITFQNKNDCQAWKSKQNCPKDCPYLDGNCPKKWLPHYPTERRKKNRIFQRMLTGFQIAQNNNAFMRFMTLTSAPQQKRTMKESFSVLKLRIQRATVEKDGFLGFKFNRYFCLRTSEGHGVMHIVFWGRYIPQEWLSKNWLDIHGAFRVDIRACFTKKRHVDGLVNYLLTNYLTEQPIERMSYGWRWAWLGFCKSWERVKETYGWLRRVGEGEFGVRRGFVFQHVFHNRSVEAWHCTLWEHPSTSRQAKLWGSKSLCWLDARLREVGKTEKADLPVKSQSERLRDLGRANKEIKRRKRHQTCFRVIWNGTSKTYEITGGILQLGLNDLRSY